MSRSPRRRFRFSFEVVVPACPAATAVWVPWPIEDGCQSLLSSALPPGLAAVRGHDRQADNRSVCFEVPASPQKRAFEVTFEVERRGCASAPPSAAGYAAPPGGNLALAAFLRADRKVPLDGVIGEQASRLGSPLQPPLVLARRAYDYLLETLTYDGRGCTPDRADELGDLPKACSLHLGTCTDFHGLFVGYLRALGVPARFTFGFNIPRGRTEGRIGGYHCWAAVADPAGDWFPVDVSEARKRPELTDFYFGSLDPDRIAFTHDRDVNLEPLQKTGPLDKFIFPHAESGAQAVTLELGFRFEESS